MRDHIVRLKVTGYLIVRVPGEDDEDVQETAESMTRDELPLDDLEDIELEVEEIEQT